MNSSDNFDSRPAVAKKIAPDASSPAFVGSSVPKAFFFKTEREMETGVRRGRKSSRSSVVLTDVSKDIPDDERTFGVQSLEETLSTLSPEPEEHASRTASASTDRSSEANIAGADMLSPAKRKRRTGNRVHPSIRSAGERIISSERVPAQTPPALHMSPDSPFRKPYLRRNSAASPINMTPIRMSPQRVSATPSTPRSGSPRSFQLSDVESNTEETGSQAIQSSSGNDDPEHMPQLVMPSLTMPTRRAFTETGKYIGRARFLIVGQRRGIGSTSLISNMLQFSEHVVHVDHVADQLYFGPEGDDLLSTSGGTDKLDQHTHLDEPESCQFVEVLASTRMLPTWRSQKSQSEQRRTSHKKPGIGEGTLDRNLAFIEAPGLDDDGAVRAVSDYITASMHRTACIESMTESEIVNMLSGDGGCHLTAVIYLFDPEASESPLSGLSIAHQDLLRRISRYTNLIPVIGKVDTVSSEAIQTRKEQILQILELLHATPYAFTGLIGGPEAREPFAISSLPGDDRDTIDASILMSSQYLAPLVTSELGQFVENLIKPESLARLRYEGSCKFIAWRHENTEFDLEQQRIPYLLSPHSGYQNTDLASDVSFPENSSKSLLPPQASSFSRSGSPALPDSTTNLEAAAMGTSALARYNQQTQPTEPYRQVRLAKWAKDLQSSLQNQSRRYQKMYQLPVSDWTFNEEDQDHALVAKNSERRLARGHLGGEVGVIDPRDPLGMLAFAQAFRHRGFLVVQVIGGCGIVGAAFYYVVKNWPGVFEFVGLSSPTDMVATTAVPPPLSRDQGAFMRWLTDPQLLGWAR